MEKYDNYKDSGIDWVGEIPEHWGLKKFGQVSYMKGRIGWQGLKQTEFTQNSEDPFLITGMNFHSGIIRWDEVYHITEDRYEQAPEIQLKNYDVLITKDGTIGKLLFVEEIPYPFKASLNSHLLVLRPLNDSYYPRYLYYQLQSLPFKHHVELTKTGTTFFGITQEAMGQYKMILPAKKEQKSIANFLDRKTAEIDRIIANKQKLITFYEEEKQAIINQAVTKGLDPTVKLKESGVEWLGEIPEHWEIKKLKYIIKINSGEGIKSDDIKPIGDYPVYGGNGIAGYTNTFNSKNDDIIIGRVGAKCGNVRLVYDEKWISDNALVASIISDIDIYFLTIQLQLMDLNNMANQNAQPLITGTMVKNSFIAVPNKNEQFEIVKSLNSECNQIETIIAKFNKQIGLLKEYRTTLISEVVTGKIMVTENENK